MLQEKKMCPGRKRRYAIPSFVHLRWIQHCEVLSQDDLNSLNTQVGKWREFNFCWSRPPLYCWRLACLPRLAVRPHCCWPGGSALVLILRKEDFQQTNKQEVPGRQLLLDRLLWTEVNGSVTHWPRVAGGRPSDTEQPGPETLPTIIVF